MKTIATVFAVHNHQPIGNFEKVFEEAYQRSYKPFLEVVEQHPHVKITQHWTGTLLEWLVAKHPELIDKMKEMVKRGQLELLTGSYYEAILAIIPESDRIGQIRKLSDYIQKTFDYEPRGMWLAERVWEQPLVASLARAGVEFVMIDDTHFRHVGLHDEELLGYYITEEQGHTLKVLPIDKVLRYTVPFRALDETLHYLQNVSSESKARVVISADDGEKFGVWPKTYDTVYTNGWLESFLSMIEKNSWIRMMHLADVVDNFAARGRIYLPTASYAEMLKWALNPAAFLQLEQFEKELKDKNCVEDNMMFVRGGYWRNFLAKYPESNHMHKKMMRIASRVEALAGKTNVSQDILDNVWAGQCNDPYWHGVFGGLYLPNLRFPVFRNLLQAESKLDAIEKLPSIRVEESDFDCDGSREILVESDVMNLYFKPDVGGSLVELDYKPLAFNILDILSRREEGYHRRLMAKGGKLDDSTSVHDGVLVKEPGLEKHLDFDWYRHASLVDHFFGPDTTLEAYAQCKYLELGDFVNQAYKHKVSLEKEGIKVMMRRDGALWLGESPHRITVQKVIKYTKDASEFSVDYTITNGEESAIDLWFGVEFSIGLMAGDAHDRYYTIEKRSLDDKRLRSIGVEENVKKFSLVDEWLGLETSFTLKQPATLWRHPIETVSLSEAGFERIYQCSVVTPTWRTKLLKEVKYQIIQRVKKL
jgi:alpha-amylase